MLGVNRVTLLGYIDTDPKSKTLENGRVRTSFGLVTNDSYINKEGLRVTNKELHYVVFWPPMAEIAMKMLAKGNRVYIEGKIAKRSYVKGESVKQVTEIVGQHFLLLENGKEELHKNGVESFNITDEDIEEDLVCSV